MNQPTTKEWKMNLIYWNGSLMMMIRKLSSSSLLLLNNSQTFIIWKKRNEEFHNNDIFKWFFFLFCFIFFSKQFSTYYGSRIQKIVIQKKPRLNRPKNELDKKKEYWNKLTSDGELFYLFFWFIYFTYHHHHHHHFQNLTMKKKTKNKK